MKERCRGLRRRATLPERALWELLRGRQLDGHKFRRQHQFGACILDFYCVEKRLAVEVDGRQHETGVGPEYDAARTNYLETQGVRVIRFTNAEVLRTPQAVVSALRRALGQLG
ncbi:MAG: endonuclease domain-containing protein [Deltaproteobacteria bacterium]|nr:endonuclease domain-containing protein [Deltaproteobacteria bacterium]